jgi:hypothetical protein
MYQLSDWTTGIIIVTFVYGLFIIASILRLRKDITGLRSPESIDKFKQVKFRLGIICECIILLGTSVTYIIFMVNVGR